MTNEERARRLCRVYSLLLSLNGEGEGQVAGGECLDGDTQAATDDTLAEELGAITLEGGHDDVSSDWTTN